jgi:aminopeptidase
MNSFTKGGGGGTTKTQVRGMRRRRAKGEELRGAIDAIFKVNLGVRKSERVLVFTDRVSARERPAPGESKRRAELRGIASLAAEAATRFSRETSLIEYAATGSHGAEPPAKIWEAAFGRRAVEELRDAGLLAHIIKKRASEGELGDAEAIITKNKRHAVQAVVALSNYSTSHTRFRDFLTRLCGARYASMPLFDLSMLEGAMDVDWKALEKRTREIARMVSGASAIEFRAANGTELAFSKRGRKARSDAGALRRRGSFGNLPAGEVYLAPVEGTANGTLVLEWAPTRRLASPVVLTVKDGFVTEVAGREPYRRELAMKLSERKENGNIAELGIGTNDKASRPDNILESEKILGTVHVALGDNSSFGGRVKAPFHQDFVFFGPTVVLVDVRGKRTELMRNGRFRAGIGRQRRGATG